MSPGLLLFFSAKFLSHRQASSRSNPVHICKPLFTYSSDENAKFFSHCRCSFQKNIMEKKKEETEEKEAKKTKDNKNKEKISQNMRKNI